MRWRAKLECCGAACIFHGDRMAEYGRNRSIRSRGGLMTVIDLTALGGGGGSGPYRRVAVFGGGAWGTALAAVAARAGRETTL
ncbi:MAG: hypothetical protein ACK4WC_15680, partial [Rubrimonas sp.]